MAHDKPLTAKSSIGDWLKHPVGGKLIADLMAEGGQDVSLLKPVRMLSLQRLAGMSRGMLPMDRVEQLVIAANGGVAPVDAGDQGGDDDQGGEAGEWVERIVPGRFEGKTVIITGAGSGIGRATATRVAREGGRVIAVDISAERLADFAASLPGADIVTVVADITQAEGIARIVQAAGERIDGLGNIAGITDDGTPQHEASDAVWQRVFSINVDGMFRLGRAVLPIMLAQGAGSIVNVASEAGLRGSAAGVAYTASKHAVVGLTRSSAYMYSGTGIRVNAVAPGGVMTNIEGAFTSEFARERLEIGRAIMPPVAMAEQLAAALCFLLSDDATNINGVILPSDGGWSVA